MYQIQIIAMPDQRQQNCVFCDIIAERNDVTVILENSMYMCILDKYPVTEGHSIVFPKEHIQYLEEAKWNQLNKFLRESMQEVRQLYDPDAMNIGINDGPEAGQTIPHLHWHVIPRYDGDISDPSGGVRGVIPEKRIYE